VHRTHTLRRWLLLSLIAASIAAPGVSGAQGPQPKGGKPRSPVVVEVRRDGFHWADAGVGAAAALATVAIAAGAVVVLRDRRDRPPARETS
jgi:hypothetical protein